MNRTKRPPGSLARLPALAFVGLTLSSGVILAAGCLSRPVVSQEPTTKTSFTADVRQAAIDKVDLLFAIDNSASMGDKQKVLALAVPDLLERLLNPKCLDNEDGQPRGTSKIGECPEGQKPEFQPVQDIHIGIVSSALGPRGGDQCTTKANDNDNGHLINRKTSPDEPIVSFQESGFLSWLPPIKKNEEKLANRSPDLSPPLDNATTLIDAFKEQVVRVREQGCGFEAQLESVYRFLIQPDPYASIERTEAEQAATLKGVDGALLQQRAQFLRPDSLVAVIMVTDENESTVDPLSIKGLGWTYTSQGWLGRDPEKNAVAPKATTACATDPMSPKCASCAGENVVDANCPGFHAPGDDVLNIRMFHMKQRFGFDPQYPIERYTRGFRDAKVPNRNGEHPVVNGQVAPYYVGRADCTNPLFAKSLPTAKDYADTAIDTDLCNLPRGPRSPDLVFFAVIGGVPYQLLSDEVEGKRVFKSQLESADWLKILGADPLKYDFSGVDPHMLESSAPRAALAPPDSNNDADPIHGREYVTRPSTAVGTTTNGTDLQYACVFDLPEAKDCTDPKLGDGCDCTYDALAHGRNSPLCAKNDKPTTPPQAGQSLNTLQTRGKAYPTIRQLSVVRALGDQGIAASICPITLKKEDLDSANYGYRPAINTIVDRLRNALSSQCLPEKLNKDTKNLVPCLILETLPQEGTQALCDDKVTYPGRKQPNAQILARFRADQAAAAGDAGASLAGYPVCELTQITVPAGESCSNDTQAGWCYVENGAVGKPAGTCAQAILFSPGANTPGSRISLQCIKATETVSRDAAAN